MQDGAFALSIDPENSVTGYQAGPGTMLGEFALITETAQPLCAIAQQPSTVMRISRSMFLKILEADADAARAAARLYCAARTRQSVADLLVVKETFDPKGNEQ